MLKSRGRLVLNSHSLISIGLVCFYLVIARNGDLSGKIALSLAMYGGCMLIAIVGSRFTYKYIKPEKLIWLVCLIPFFYCSAIWLDASLFIFGIIFIILLDCRTDDLNGLYKAIAFVALFNAICVTIQCFDNRFFDGFAKAWYPEGMYQQYLRTMKYENYLNGCNAIAGDTAGYLTICIGLLYSNRLFPKYTKRKKINAFLLIICLIATILTGKRAILLCGLTSAIILYIISGKASKKFQRFLLVILLMFVLMRSITFVAELFPGANAIVRVANSINDLLYGQDITSGRTRLYGYALLQFRAHPVLGIGWKKFNLLTTDFYNYNSGHYVNNDYLQVLCETGIVGLVCIYLPMIVFLIKTLSMYSEVVKSKANNSIKLAFVFSLFIQIFHLTYSIFEIPLYDRCFFFTYILAVSMGYCAQKEYLQMKQISGVVPW